MDTSTKRKMKRAQKRNDRKNQIRLSNVPVGHRMSVPVAPDFGPARFTADDQAANPNKPMTRVVKDLCREGSWKSGFGPDGQSRFENFDRPKLQRIVDNFHRMLDSGHAVNIGKNHGDADLAIATDDLVAPLDDMKLDGAGVLWGSAYVTPEQAEYLMNPARKVSVGLWRDYEAGDGARYPGLSALHVAVTDRPVVTGQGAFHIALSNSLSPNRTICLGVKGQVDNPEGHNQYTGHAKAASHQAIESHSKTVGGGSKEDHSLTQGPEGLHVAATPGSVRQAAEEMHKLAGPGHTLTHAADGLSATISVGDTSAPIPAGGLTVGGTAEKSHREAAAAHHAAVKSGAGGDHAMMAWRHETMAAHHGAKAKSAAGLVAPVPWNREAGTLFANVMRDAVEHAAIALSNPLGHNQYTQGTKQKKDKGAWVVHPKSGHRGVVDHTYDDNVNEHGRLVQVDYGAKKVNHREFHIAHSKDQKSKWADKPSESGFSAAAPAPAVGGPSYESKNQAHGFFGEMSHHHGSEDKAAGEFRNAARLISSAHGVHHSTAVNYLDSVHGRHVAGHVARGGMGVLEAMDHHHNGRGKTTAALAKIKSQGDAGVFGMSNVMSEAVRHAAIALGSWEEAKHKRNHGRFASGGGGGGQAPAAKAKAPARKDGTTPGHNSGGSATTHAGRVAELEADKGDHAEFLRKHGGDEKAVKEYHDGYFGQPDRRNPNSGKVGQKAPAKHEPSAVRGAIGAIAGAGGVAAAGAVANAVHRGGVTVPRARSAKKGAAVVANAAGRAAVKHVDAAKSFGDSVKRAVQAPGVAVNAAKAAVGERGRRVSKAAELAKRSGYGRNVVNAARRGGAAKAVAKFVKRGAPVMARALRKVIKFSNVDIMGAAITFANSLR